MSPSLYHFDVIILDPVEKNLSTGALDEIGVSYSKKAFNTAGYKYKIDNSLELHFKYNQYLPYQNFFIFC